MCGKCPGKEGKPPKISSGLCSVCGIQYEDGEPVCDKCGRPIPWPPGTRVKKKEIAQ